MIFMIFLHVALDRGMMVRIITIIQVNSAEGRIANTKIDFFLIELSVDELSYGWTEIRH